ncbi:hypothetical protein C0Q70_02021 [Pomacea canaliculata]|uniref:Uncharacterized protein n=1 Tax=Pomacea canaliculata TaxID=400727 RepID=A0A2T7Q142_POMCA|nr:hypothetical protein C0Q70_02021 [Pomacea canaliculata]
MTNDICHLRSSTNPKFYKKVQRLPERREAQTLHPDRFVNIYNYMNTVTQTAATVTVVGRTGMWKLTFRRLESRHSAFQSFRNLWMLIYTWHEESRPNPPYRLDSIPKMLQWKLKKAGERKMRGRSSVPLPVCGVARSRRVSRCSQGTAKLQVNIRSGHTSHMV